MLCINAGSGQSRFDPPFVNLDIQVVPGRRPDVQADMFRLPFHDGSVEVVVSHHTLEHLGCGEADGFIREAHRVLRRGGSLLVFVPDVAALARRWLQHQITDYIFFVNVYGAYQGDEHDRHRWNCSAAGWREELIKNARWQDVKLFDWRPIAGASICRDWWILGMEAVK